MTKTLIELYNSDKYQPVLQDAIYDKVQGQSNELILSGDGRETSASGNTTGSITLNVSGGMWTDHGSFNTQQFGVSGSIANNTSNNTIFTFNSNIYKACFVDLLFTKSNGDVAVERVTIAVDGASTTVDRTAATQPSYYGWNVVNGSGNCIVQINQAAAGDTYKAVVRLL